MKKRLVCLFLLCFLLTACASTPQAVPTTQPTQTLPTSPVIRPLPQTLDIHALDACTVAVSLEKGDAYVDDTGLMQMKLTVYVYDLYDMVDIATLQVGSTILLQQQEISVTQLEQTEYGLLINGGPDVGGYILCTDDNTVYYESGYSDVKSWYSLGEVTVPVSQDFLYTDASDLDREPTVYYPGDFLQEDSGIDYFFTPQNTTVTISDGMVVSMHRVYIP